MVPLMGHAAGFAPLVMSDTGDVCYSWNGGHKSAGSFSNCQPSVQVTVLTPVPPEPVVQQAPAPIMQACPPQISVMPEPHKKRPIIRHRPKVECKPVS